MRGKRMEHRKQNTEVDTMAKSFRFDLGGFAKTEVDGADALSPNLYPPVISLCPAHQDN